MNETFFKKTFDLLYQEDSHKNVTTEENIKSENQIRSTNIKHRLPSRVEPQTLDYLSVQRKSVQRKSTYKIIHTT